MAVSEVLDRVDALADVIVADVVSVVQMPSVSGTDGENAAQSHMAELMVRGGLDVDHWELDLAAADESR